MRKGITGKSVLAHTLRFLFFSGVLLLVAWIAGTGRVAYMMTMLLIAAALGFAVLDSIGYEVAKKDRRG